MAGGGRGGDAAGRPAAAAQDHAVEDHAAQDQPKLLPTRDVDITYDVTRPQQPRTRERVRWLAGEHLERVDFSGRSTTIFDRNTREVTLLTPANRTYRKLDGAPRRALEPEPGRFSSAAATRSLPDCPAPTGRGRRTWKRTPFARPRTA